MVRSRRVRLLEDGLTCGVRHGAPILLLRTLSHAHSATSQARVMRLLVGLFIDDHHAILSLFAQIGPQTERSI